MFEMTVGLNVTSADLYARYRRGMTPILTTYGGWFRYDFIVSETLQSDAAHPINRVFSLCFPDREKRDAFFADPAYKVVRKEFFEPSVAGRTTIAQYGR